MRKLDGITWVCHRHTGERTRIMLDTLNAHARPPQTWPNKDAKPQNPEYPNTLEADEGAAFNLIDRMIQAQCRYELIESGSAPYVAGGGGLVTMAWAARYLYGLISQGTRTTLLARARVLLAQTATYILARQYGSPTGPSPQSVRATEPFFGAVTELSATLFVSEDTASSGLALLYAYRILGAASCLDGARAAATYLRNVQAIGSCMSARFTSRDTAGTARLYTGAVMYSVKRLLDVDAGGFAMYGDHLFYPSGLLTLEFWNELKTTDGDQSIGATGSAPAFGTVPAQLMSTSMTEMRACWTNGIPTATGATVNGLSSTTPAEYFNAYPLVKTNFAGVAGTGLWEYVDGPSASGTQISSQNFARALSALYAYEGATSQITAILTWLRDFDSNPAFETPANTSTSALRRTTTGEYDPAATLATLLTVRDSSNAFAAVAMNGSSVYDWGAFGVLSSLLAATNMTSFKSSRLDPLNVLQRYEDGVRNDGLIYDRIETRGISGLTFQTGFRTYSSTWGDFSSIATAPSSANLGLWFESGTGVTKNGSNQVTTWADLSNSGWDVHTPIGGGNVAPTYVANVLNGQPGIYFGNAGAFGSSWSLDHYGGPYSVGGPGIFPAGVPYPLGNLTDPNVVIAVVKVLAGAPPAGGTGGGMIFSDRIEVSRQLWSLCGTQQRMARGTIIIQANPTVDYAGQVLLMVYRFNGTGMLLSINNGPIVTYDNGTGLQSSIISPVQDAFNSHTMRIGGSEADQPGFQGYVFAIMGYRGTDVPTDTLSYLASKYNTVTGYITNDALLSSQYSLSFRKAH